MSFFWSNRSNSFAGIWKRSARYWITSYVGNCLYGPPGWRGGRMLEYPRTRTQSARTDRWSPEGYHGTDEQIACAVGYDTGYEGDQKGWSRERMVQVAHARVKQVLGYSVPRERVEAGNTAKVASPTKVSPYHLPTPRKTNRIPTRPAAVARTGGLRGGARQWS